MAVLKSSLQRLNKRYKMITFNWDHFVLQSDFYCLMIEILTVRKGVVRFHWNRSQEEIKTGFLMLLNSESKDQSLVFILF